ncbi:MAG: hypothetical protein RUMPE_00418 [Eubacteriales bacterium SKADARSKE-1]|nr:hypothetical protein [Eubacteriales bacterium SKADARSKE-1]
MISLIVGKKGLGKTKKLVDMANGAVQNSNGNVVFIEKGNKLTYDVNHDVKLVNTAVYGITSFESLFGFICGIYAENYDVTDIFVDSTLKIGGEDFEIFEDFIKKVSRVLDSTDINLVFSVSSDRSELPKDIEKFTKII